MAARLTTTVEIDSEPLKRSRKWRPEKSDREPLETSPAYSSGARPATGAEALRRGAVREIQREAAKAVSQVRASEPQSGEPVEAPRHRRQYPASGSLDPHGESPPCPIDGDLAGARFEAILCPELLGEVTDTCGSPTSWSASVKAASKTSLPGPPRPNDPLRPDRRRGRSARSQGRLPPALARKRAPR